MEPLGLLLIGLATLGAFAANTTPQYVDVGIMLCLGAAIFFMKVSR